MTDLLKDLEAVALLAERATPGEWSVVPDGTNEFGQIEYTIEVFDGSCPIVDTGVFYGDPHDANECAAAVNFIRTHHAEIAEAVKDARRWLYVLNNAEWIRDEDDTLMAIRLPPLTDLSSKGTRRDAIDNAMHNSAREDGE
ncbi:MULTISPECIES: hypothetical protein [unclassified Rhodanobacter]|uniref:hypothetical protein n=1 Tax=unclassified Rhodanobacter TaxID=2621553 RepID=UPI0034E5F6A0